jgi:hypothetical protein
MNFIKLQDKIKQLNIEHDELEHEINELSDKRNKKLEEINKLEESLKSLVLVIFCKDCANFHNTIRDYGICTLTNFKLYCTGFCNLAKERNCDNCVRECMDKGVICDVWVGEEPKEKDF